MINVLEILLLIASIVLSVPLLVLAVESCAALLPRRRVPPTPASDRPRCAVVVPAHDETAAIGRTVRAILAQLQPGDRLLVIADNCTDSTAAAARESGAEVVERHDPVLRGKGYALDCGVRSLDAHPPAVVLFVDADCTVQPGFVEHLVRRVAATGRPAQSRNLVTLPPNSGLKEKLSWFAFRYKNLVRPLGLARLGLPCLLTNGVAFPWAVVKSAPLATGNIVEDMQLGLDLAVAGQTASFVASAVVTSDPPTEGRAAVTQRTRWEHGHLRTIASQAPRLAIAALCQCRIGLLGLALELSVPPLSMLFLLWSVALASASILWVAGGSPLPALILASSGLAAILAIFGAWAKFARNELPLRTLLAAPVYALSKLPIYAASVLRPQRTWVRTERSES